MGVRDRIDLRKQLMAVAASQSGYFTAAQALDVGYSYPAQKYHADRGNWERVDRGLYRIPEWPPDFHDDLVRIALWSRGRAVVSHDTALSTYELGDFDPAHIHLIVPLSFRARGHGLVLHLGNLPGRDVRWHTGYRITTPLRSLLDVAAAPADQSLFNGAISDALDRGMTTRNQLLHRAGEFGPQASLAVERALVAHRIKSEEG
jgi:predicted transcriptional regulator of viral defense system